MDGRSGKDFFVTVRTGDPDRVVPEVLTRCQRVLANRNTASSHERFGQLLEAHRELHDLTRPLVRADYDHALDVWQWVLRLDSGAAEEVQVAALFHDIERLESEASARIEHQSSDYVGFKQRHAERGGMIASVVLRRAGYEEDAIRRITSLVALHEQPGEDEDLMLLNEADALSFFSFNSPGFFDYFDEEHCVKKVDYTLRRLGARGAALLNSIHLRDDVAAVVRACGGNHVRTHQ